MQNSIISNKYDYLISCLIASLAFGSLGGAFEAPRVLAILFAPALFSMKNCPNYITKQKLFCFVWYIWILFSFLWTPDQSAGAKALVYYIVHLVYFLEILAFSTKAANPVQSISNAWLIALFCLSLIGLWEIFTDNHLSVANLESAIMMSGGTGMSIMHRFASTTFMNYNDFVTFICLGLPFLFTITLSKQTLFKKGVFIFTFISSLIILLFNASRGGILSALIVLSVFMYYSRFMRNGKLLFILLIGILSTIMYLYGDIILEVISIRASNTVSIKEESRWIVWVSALKVFNDTYWIGTGVAGVPAAMAKFTSGVLSPHNFFLELLAEFGILIFITITFMCIKLIHIVNHLRPSLTKTILLMAMLSFPSTAIIQSGYLLCADTYAFFACLVAFAYSEKIIQQKNQC